MASKDVVDGIEFRHGNKLIVLGCQKHSYPINDNTNPINDNTNLINENTNPIDEIESANAIQTTMQTKKPELVSKTGRSGIEILFPLTHCNDQLMTSPASLKPSNK